jgi:uncharacterized protein (TIGR03437 family)
MRRYLVSTLLIGLPMTVGCGVVGAADGSSTVYTIATVAGSDWVGDNGSATEAILLQAEGVATDASGNLYIADAQEHRVRQVSASGLIRTVAGTGMRGFSGDGGAATAAQLNSPYGVALDRAGNLYIADLGNHRVRRVSPAGTIATVASSPLQSPRNLAVDNSGVLFVSDFDGHCVYRLAPEGVLVAAAGTGVPGYSGDGGAGSSGQLNYPAALAFDQAGGLYIADSQNHAIRKVVRGVIGTVLRAATPTGMAFDASGTLHIADPAAGEILRIPVSGVSTALQVPARDLAFAADGSLYASGSGVVRRILASGIVSTVAGGGDLAHGDRGDARKARLNHPSGVAADASGNLYIADRDNHRIRRVSPEGIITTVAGTGERGDSGDLGPATKAQLNQPSSVTADAAGNLYIADTGNHRVRRVTPLGQILPVAPAVSPVYAVADAAGAVYIADAGAGKILKATSGGQIITLAQGLQSPHGVALDKSGVLYFTETGAGRVRKLMADPAGILDAGDRVWSIPRGIAIDDAGNLYVADSGLGRVIRVDPAGVTTPIAGDGTTGFSGDGDAALAAHLGYPWDIAAGPNGRLYVADLDNHRIRSLTPAAAAPIAPLLLTDTVNAASLQPGPLAPGMLVVIRNSPVTPADIPDAQFLFGGLPGQFVSIGKAGILVAAPADLPITGSLLIDVRVKGISRAVIPSVAAPSAPALFADASGQAAAANDEGVPNSRDHPAAHGSILSLYGTGLGIPGLPVAVRIADQTVEVLYAGPVAAYPGMFQINAGVPEGVSGTVSIVVSVGESSTQPGLTISVR